MQTSMIRFFPLSIVVLGLAVTHCGGRDESDAGTTGGSAGTGASAGGAGTGGASATGGGGTGGLGGTGATAGTGGMGGSGGSAAVGGGGGTGGTGGTGATAGTGGSARSDAAADAALVCPTTILPSIVSRTDFEQCVATDGNDPWICWVCANCLTEVNACWGDIACDAAQLAYDGCIADAGTQDASPLSDAAAACDTASLSCFQKAVCASPLAWPYLTCVAGAP